MDRESYSRPELAAFINANFVPVKVDYNAQPGLAIELERVQALLNLPSGLPLTGFLTPEKKFHLGGTYFARSEGFQKPLEVSKAQIVCDAFCWPTRASAGKEAPVKPKSGAMPAHDRLRLYNDQRLRPS
jgi:hypothetical protein